MAEIDGARAAAEGRKRAHSEELRRRWSGNNSLHVVSKAEVTTRPVWDRSELLAEQSFRSAVLKLFDEMRKQIEEETGDDEISPTAKTALTAQLEESGSQKTAKAVVDRLEEIRWHEKLVLLVREVVPYLDPLVVGSLAHEDALDRAKLIGRRILYSDGVAHALVVGAEVKEIARSFGIDLENDLATGRAVGGYTETLGAPFWFYSYREGVVGGAGAVQVEGDDVTSGYGQRWLVLTIQMKFPTVRDNLVIDGFS